MKTANEVKVELQDLIEERNAARHRFDEDYNHEDMREMELLDARIAEVEWVLG